ncbi:MAG TPA: FAD-binding oxidoreductase [Acidobacteriota bacterium]|nr:FAD-binding oxidoreductase [Acidobacteriota bacterium]
MKRRAFLKRLAGTATLAFPPFSVVRQARPRVGVVGGGIVGVSISLHLARGGADVVLFERQGAAAGATSKSFAWLNAMSANVDYHALRRRSLLAWRELASQVGLQVNWGGVFMWERRGTATEQAVAELRALQAAISTADYPLRSLTPSDFSTIAPEISPGDFEIAIHCGVDGHIDPVAVTNKLLQAAGGHGVDITMPCEVTAIRMESGRIRAATTAGDYHLDRLVIAAGVDSARLTSLAGYQPPLDHAPGILAHSRSMQFASAAVHYAPGVHFKQFPDGRIVGADSDRPPDTPAHEQILRRAGGFPDQAMRDEHGERILARIGDVMPDARHAELDRLTLGFRPMPSDGLPIVGYVPGSAHVYLAVMHSGVTLAPIMGQLISREVLSDNGTDLLGSYRPDRFSGRDDDPGRL